MLVKHKSLSHQAGKILQYVFPKKAATRKITDITIYLLLLKGSSKRLKKVVAKVSSFRFNSTQTGQIVDKPMRTFIISTVIKFADSLTTTLKSAKALQKDSAKVHYLSKIALFGHFDGVIDTYFASDT